MDEDFITDQLAALLKKEKKGLTDIGLAFKIWDFFEKKGVFDWDVINPSSRSRAWEIEIDD